MGFLQVHHLRDAAAFRPEQFALRRGRAINPIIRRAEKLAQQRGFRGQISALGVRRQHAVLDVHARIQGKLIDLAQDDRLVRRLLGVLAHDHRPAGVQRGVEIIVAAMDVEGVLGQRARAHFQDHGGKFARRVVILLHRVREPLPGSEIHRAAAGDGKRGRAPLRGVLAFGLDGDLLLAPNVQFALREGSLVNLAPFRRGRDGIENTAFGDADFNMLGHQSIAVAGDTDAGIFRPGMARVECWDALFFGKG